MVRRFSTVGRFDVVPRFITVGRFDMVGRFITFVRSGLLLDTAGGAVSAVDVSGISSSHVSEDGPTPKNA